MSQISFGERLGMNRDAVNNIENGRIKLKKFHIRFISLAYGVNENWLETGEGDMFLDNKNRSDPLKSLSSEYMLNDDDISFIMRFVKMSAEERQAIHNLFG